MGPKGMALDLNGHIIVVDKTSSPFSPIALWLAYVGTVWPLTAGPHLVAVDKDEIVVMDFHNHSVKVFSAS